MQFQTLKKLVIFKNFARAKSRPGDKKPRPVIFSMNAMLAKNIFTYSHLSIKNSLFLLLLIISFHIDVEKKLRPCFSKLRPPFFSTTSLRPLEINCIFEFAKLIKSRIFCLYKDYFFTFFERKKKKNP
jgi:hypothetical protein